MDMDRDVVPSRTSRGERASMRSWERPARVDPDASMPRIVPFDRASPYFAGAVAVYTQTWQHPWSAGESYFHRYSTGFPGFLGRVALLDGLVVGAGFGMRSLPGQWWHDTVAGAVGINHPALRDAWVLAELAILEPYRGRGIGSSLHDALLAAKPCPRTLLSTELQNTRAQRFYRRLGWRSLHPGLAFRPGNPLFVVLGREEGIHAHSAV